MDYKGSGDMFLVIPEKRTWKRVHSDVFSTFVVLPTPLILP